MKIMVVHHFGQIGGGTNSCFDVCRMLVEEGHDVVVVIPNPSDPVIQLAQDINVRLIASPVKAVCLSCHNADSGTVKTMAKFVLSIKNTGYWKRLFQKEQPDLIMLNSSVQGPLVYIAHQLGIKTICFIRETVREKGVRFWKNVNKKLLSKADGLAFLTSYDVLAWNIPCCGRQIVIPDIVDEKRFKLDTKVNECHEYDLDSEERYLLYLGGLSEEKGALDLLRAFRICAQRNEKLYLIILGDTTGGAFQRQGVVHRLFRHKAIKYYETCKKELAILGKEYGRVLEIGLVSDVSPWYCRADAIIFPVKKVHQARPVFEAGLFRKPVIVPDYANFQDSVMTGFNGVIYRKDRVDDMAEKILGLLESEDALRKMGENNYEVYCKEHTYQVAKEKLNELIRVIAEKTVERRRNG